MFFVHFGLDQYLGYLLYASFIVAFLLSVFWRPLIGIYYLVPLIPLQTIRYRMGRFPLGETVVGIILLGVALGLLRRRKWILPRTPWTVLLCVYMLFLLATVFLDSDNIGPRLKEWQDYMMMPLLFFMVAGAVETPRQMQLLLVLMCASAFMMDRSFWNAIKDRDFSSFSRDLQEGGAMGYSGVQGMAAFNAQYAWFLLALAGARQRRLIRWTLAGLAAFAANCVMYAFSRGGYVAFLAGWLFIGAVKHRSLLVLLAVFGLTWTALVPKAVRERVTMTYDKDVAIEKSGDATMDHSAEVRIELWTDALELFKSNPLLGSGFHTYAYMKRVGSYADTHNIYLKVLIETGLVGLALFLWLLAKTLRVGYGLFRKSRDPFFSALGLGLAVWVVSNATASLFGDRWTHFQINGYMWVLAGFAARAIALESEAPDAEQPAGAVAGSEVAVACN